MSVSAEDDATLPGDGTSLPGGGSLEGWLRPGAPVGRYMVLARLGAGGMGVVYAAYDPELDRKVALKLLRPSPGVHEGSRDRDHRLLKQEAQALAKLSHPNVIAIHDVGEHEGRVFLAMEFVDGGTLGQWMKGEHDWRERLDVLLRAGDGLAAAHEQGLVHRDFKPDNVMVAKDGRVRVMDFGLARQAVSLQTLPEVPAAGGGLVGTPAYMAPEQLAGRCADARSDQFSFCVALWEGLYGTRPFVASDVLAQLEEIEHGRIQPPARRGAVPGWVRRVLLTGLRADAEQRYPSMAALLAALRRDPSHARRRLQAVAAAAGLLGAGWGAVAWNEAATLAACEAAGREIDEEWTPQRRAEVERAIVSHDVTFARETWERVAPRLDAYASEWSRTRQAACTAHRVEQRWDEALAVRADECLQERRAALASALEVLASVSREELVLVQGTLASLPPLDACLDETSLGRRPLRPADQRARALAVRTEAARANVEWRAGRQVTGQARLEAALVEAQALDDPALVATAEAGLGELLLTRGEHQQGAARLRAAYYRAGTQGNDDAQVGLAANLARVEAEHLGRLDVAEQWIEHAAMLHQRVKGADAEEPVSLIRSRGILKAERGDYEAARTLARLAQARAEQVFGPDHPSVDAAASTVMDVEDRLGNYDAALASALGSLARQRRAWGDHHPEVARTLANVATAYSTLGELEPAQRFAEEAVEVTRESLGPDHPRTADALRALAAIESKRGRLDVAIPRYERALAIYDGHQPMAAESVRAMLGGLLTKHGEHARAIAMLEAVLEAQRDRLGRDSPELMTVLINLGAAQRGGGDLDGAARTYREALRVGDASLASDHPTLAFPLNNLGSLEQSRGNLEVARPLIERALEIRLAKLGDHHPLVASTLDALARLELDEGRADAAVERLEQAVAIMVDTGADPLRRAQIELQLARALMAAGREPARALALASACVRAFTELGRDDDRREAEALRRELEAPAPAEVASVTSP